MTLSAARRTSRAFLSAAAVATAACAKGDALVAFNLGAGFGDLERWALRPEIGFLLDPDSSGYYTQLSVGLTVFAGERKARR